jgi:hypothetical protein
LTSWHCRFHPGNDADAPTLTKHLLSALATAVVTTKMINTQQEGSPETPPLPVALAASLGEGASAPPTPIYSGRPTARKQPNRNRVDDHGARHIRRGTPLLIIQLPGSNWC